MIKNITEIEKALGLEPGAFESETEVTVDLDNLHISTKEIHSTLLENIKKDSFSNGGKTANEILLKEMKEKAGLDYEGRKNPDAFVKALTESVLLDSKVEPEKKYKQLKTSFDTLQNNYKNSETKYNDLVGKNDLEAKTRRINDNWKNAFDKGSYSIDSNDSVLLTNAKVSTTINDEGQFEHSINGVVQRDVGTEGLMSSENVMSSVLESYAKTTNNGGAGGKDDKGNLGSGTWEALEKELSVKGISINGQEGQQIVNERVANGTLKM